MPAKLWPKRKQSALMFVGEILTISADYALEEAARLPTLMTRPKTGRAAKRAFQITGRLIKGEIDGLK